MTADIGMTIVMLEKQLAQVKEAVIKSMNESAENAGFVRHGLIVPLAVVERRAVLNAVRLHAGDSRAAARALGIGRTTLYRKLKEYRG